MITRNTGYYIQNNLNMKIKFLFFNKPKKNNW